jgi:hypothetical protein
MKLTRELFPYIEKKLSFLPDEGHVPPPLPEFKEMKEKFKIH